MIQVLQLAAGQLDVSVSGVLLAGVMGAILPLIPPVQQASPGLFTWWQYRVPKKQQQSQV